MSTELTAIAETESPGDASLVALKRLEEGNTVISSLKDKPSQGRDASSKALDVLDRPRYLHVQDGLNFFSRLASIPAG
ncbi:hypothetical protein L3X38_032586 [Prunus dulcis]|uniref:Uncharacterized protein n=1 Tax=Prunus dulcis TaxID=3755 RepID=A0AAD4YW60_PRUDU|nr:hypothetical protein L3X38_032586 [Prunus dulcis]